ncbi:MAG: hypothetical protein FWG12_01935 [Holophagaceae bacterium]|nr:hypothetical protein [Holophagaceae bacterium]
MPPNHKSNPPAQDSNCLVFNIRISVVFEEGASTARVTNKVLAALIEGIEGCIFPLWVSAEDGEESMITLADFEIFP